MSGYFDNVKYTIVDKQAYTKDDILIKKLFFCFGPLMPMTIANEMVLEYFQQFGNVVKIKYCDKIDIFCKGTVEFADSNTATRVLQIKKHQLKPFKFCKVEPSNSWTQPEGKDMILFLENMSTIYNEPKFNSSYYLNKTSIVCLNDDCLRYIYNCLSLKDQINLALTCQFFFNMIKKMSSVKYRNLETSNLNSLTHWQKLVFLKMVGKCVETLDVEYGNDKYLVKFLGSSCIKVKTLYLHKCTFRLFNLIGKMKYLSKLTLKDVDVCDGSLLTITQTFPNLKCLSLMHNWKLTGKHIIKFNGLEELHIENCENLNAKHLIEICRVLKTLRHLTIIASYNLEENHCKAISKNLLKLESLKLWTDSINFNGVAKLPNLSKLEIGRHNKIENIYVRQEPIELIFFEDLFKYKRKKLEELRLHGSNWINLEKAFLLCALKNLKVLICPNNEELYDTSLEKFSELTELQVLNVSGCNVTNDGVLHLIKHCKKLKLLELIAISSLTDNLLTNMLPILKKQHASLQRDYCLEVRVDESKFGNVLFNNPELAEYSNILKITLNKDEGDFEDYLYD